MFYPTTTSELSKTGSTAGPFCLFPLTVVTNKPPPKHGVTNSCIATVHHY
eukprot:gnl/Chilomastix_caulleri/6482.p1 GENE.gnl/Chilomastix_caulleri/6482~~gnl/Chilomastix_caulleri/6482.p1  ORF type:complete len:50 (-),score=4.34 gnl/Chilomastix_caulleri/6482:113-262(-)